eukprot:Cvel_23830.t2-p1 / transcript=Cvel_23830.t2 / gene=Cvel_23830 / organism=Chromera_velia_CCMP2878 / gene_product=Cold shock protein 2, putative / transcript_product=Cold shock protein 2, putative / location=Cvel_scaffold2505:14235-25042(+) / protein_length=533 / sequence_SO=supercontig / SO=protein_coding / is_pseudo=false
MPQKLTGSCKWFNTKKGFGFITPDDGTPDIFVHQSSLYCKGFRSLADGAKVEFSRTEDDNGRPKAVDVTGPNGDYCEEDKRAGGGGGGGGYGGERGYGGGGGGAVETEGMAVVVMVAVVAATGAESLDFSSVPSIGSLFSPTRSIRDSSSESDSVPSDPDSEPQQQQADMGDAVRFDKLEQIGKVKRVTTVFIPGKTNGQVWYATFKAKADAGNLNMNEKKLLLVGHFEDPDLILWWNENSASATTSDEVDTLFLEAHGSTGVIQAHAVYRMADVRLNLGDDYDKFVERFVDVYIQVNPNRRRNDRISSFVNALYPELREELEIEQIYTDWDQLKRRVGYLHAKQQKKARARIAGVQQRDERDELAELRKRLDQQAAQIAALRGRGRGHRQIDSEQANSKKMEAEMVAVKVGPRPFMTMLLFDKPVSVLIDTGAETSFIDVNTTLHADADVDRPTVGLSAVGQTGVSVVGEITAKFSHPSLPKKVFPHCLTVTEDSGYKAVLGQDFLKLLDPVVQYHYREDHLDVADLPSFEV